MAYCTTADLLLGNLESRLPITVDPTEYINTVADEIDARIGVLYVTPVEIAGVNAVPAHQAKLLKGINAKRATGRIIMAVAVASEDNAVHQYAMFLLQEADLELAAIANGDVILTWDRVDSEGNPITDPLPDPDDLDPWARTPSATNHDAFSAVTAFEENIHQGYPATWRPGDGSQYDWPMPRRAGG